MTSIGLDYASVDDNEVPDFVAAKRAGARFAILRAVYGRRVAGQRDNLPVYIDPVWARDSGAVKAAGLKRTAYLFVCYPRAGVETPSPEMQAQMFIDHVQLERNHDYVPMLDVEEESDGPDGLDSFGMYDWTLCVCKKLRDHYGAWPGMYTSARVWSEILCNHDAGELLECPLWLAAPWPLDVETKVDLDGAPGYSPYTISQFGDATNYWLYQYQGDATQWPGFSSTVDANRFHTVARGSNGTIVRWIQRRVGAFVDGDFGPQTESAVKAFQIQHGLLADGIVGPLTFAPLSWVP
jgi:peptidoglycan hydrolase-like protein with peptidoglycan-binding domain